MYGKVWIAIIYACVILALSVGVRQGFGLFVGPMALDLGWSLGSLTLALAVQNLVWGLGQPVAGLAADRYGVSYVLSVGAGVYALGILLMVVGRSEGMYALGAGVLVGLGVSATAFPIVLGAVGGLVAPERRTLVFSIVSAGGSLGQFVVPPASQYLIGEVGWRSALLFLAATLAIIPISLAFGSWTRAIFVMQEEQTSAPLRGALEAAMGHKGYWLLCAGFFVCGFHVALIATHLPIFVSLCGLGPMVGASALSLIGLFNIAGTLSAGVLATRWTNQQLLCAIYLARAAVILVFLEAPKSEPIVLAFAATMGFLWLCTVPLTSGIVAQIFGPRYVASLFGIVFLSHQLGAFFGAWSGGYIFDHTGSYSVIWEAAAALGVLAGFLSLPISSRPLAHFVEAKPV